MAQADPYARTKILASVNRQNRHEKAKDYNWHGVNLANEEPIPANYLCDVEDFSDRGERRPIIDQIGPPIQFFEPTAQGHRHLNRPPHYDLHHWYKCRRRAK